MTIDEVMEYSKSDSTIRIYREAWGNKLHGEPFLAIYYKSGSGQDWIIKEGEKYNLTTTDKTANDWCIYDFNHNCHTKQGIIVAWHGEIKKIYNTTAIRDYSRMEKNVPLMVLGEEWIKEYIDY